MTERLVQPYEGPRHVEPGACWMCAASDDELHRSERWRVILNHNQDRLGKVMVASLRHEEDVTRFTDEEIVELWAMVRHVTGVIRSLFQPDQFNYSFLMNLDPHAHLHVIPRYRTPREHLGISFVDDEAGGERRLAEEVHRELVRTLREAFHIPD